MFVRLVLIDDYVRIADGQAGPRPLKHKDAFFVFFCQG